MNVAVFVKWVPEPEGTPALAPDHRLVRAGADGALDPGDEFGVEAALQLVEAEGGEVIVISMGPDEALPAVQRALAMGAHRGMLITDDRLAGADALVTARVLAAAVSGRPVDLIVAAVESTDGYTGTVPVTVAEFLDLPAVTFATRLSFEDGELLARRQTPAGSEDVACSLPALVTLTAGANVPRYPSLKGIMAAKSKPLERPSADDLGLDARALEATQTVLSVEEAPVRGGGEILPAGEDAVHRIADLLAEAKVI
jgi:electron transfer flavoprotein beta subunit